MHLNRLDIVRDWPEGGEETCCEARITIKVQGTALDFFCTRPRNHAGAHVAYSNPDLPVAAWQEGASHVFMRDPSENDTYTPWEIKEHGHGLREDNSDE